MTNSFFLFVCLTLVVFQTAQSQVDSSFLYKQTTPYGPLDIRLSKGANHHYYLQEGETFSFRADADGQTGTYLDMTAWDSSPYGEGHVRERKGSADLFVMNYRLLKPKAHGADVTDGFPLVVVLHGFLERGNCASDDCYHADVNFNPNKNLPPAPTDPNDRLLNNDYNLVHGGLNYLEASQINGARLPDEENAPATAFPGFVLFPQNANGWDGEAAEDVIKLVRLIVKRYNIDEDRIYINGISHGGHGAYEVLKRAPWMFAAGVMFSAADDASIVSQGATDLIAQTPLWIFQGALDSNPTPSKTQRYVDTFRNAGGVVRYTLYPNLGHGTWNKGLSEPDFFSWMLSKRRTDIHVFGGRASLCSTSDKGNLLSLPDGFNMYEWEYNGQTMSGVTTSTYLAKLPGVYRARFLNSAGSSDKWSKWSQPLTLEETFSRQAEVKQTGTLLLPDLNGNNEVILQAMGQDMYTYWYKNGKLLNFRSSSDTLKTIVLKQERGNGAYTLAVSDYDRCLSLASKPLYVFFNSSASVALAAPYNIKAKAISPSEIQVTWNDSTRNETGFELWRREVSESNSSLWQMAQIANANATAFHDKAVEPNSTYEYLIRAINDSERSEYAGMNNQTGSVTTPVDTQAPSQPRDIVAVQTGIQTITVTWKASTDNASVFEYVIEYGDSSIHTSNADTTFVIRNLRLNKVYSIAVAAVDIAGNMGARSEAVEEDTFVEGLFYGHSTGAWQTLADIDWSISEYSGTVSDFTLSPKTQQDFFNFFFDGFLNIQTGGVYQFRMTSDDGSNLSLNDTLLIENDGIHSTNTVTGPIQILDAGPQRITVKYFDYATTDTLLIEYKGPDTGDTWIKIPEEALRSNIIASLEEPTHAEHFDFGIHPNPVAYETIHLTIDSKQEGPVSINLFDLVGKRMFESTFEFNEVVDVMIPTSVKPGMYLISLRQGANVRTRRLMIE